MTTLRHASGVLTIVGFMIVASYTLAADSRPAPNVEMQTADGQTVHLADLKGHVVLIDFWASWCRLCGTSFPALDALYREWHSHGLEVLAVNLDTVVQTRRHSSACTPTSCRLSSIPQP